jgi:phage major head subunit gpT-like protein
VIGSARDLRVEGSLLLSRVQYSSVPEAESPATKTREGHLTDFSIGYVVLESAWIKEGESSTINGRTFNGPLRVVTRWKGKELSVCPIGADEQAKARSESRHEYKEPHMDKHLRAFLVRRGLAADATDEQAWEYYNTHLGENGNGERSAPAVGQQATPPQQPVVDPQEAARAEVAAERARTVEITAMARSFGCDEMIDQLVADGTGIDAARAAINAKYLKQQEDNQPQVGFRTSIVLGTESRDKFRDGCRSALLMQGGVGEEKPAAGATELAGRSMVEMCRMALVQAGQSDNGNGLEVVGRALTASDMPVILGNTANLSLMAGFEAAEETYQTWCDTTGSVSDFKIHTAARAGELGDLDEIPDGGEYKDHKPIEQSEQYKIATYGKIYPITRQAIINDDIGALTDIPRQHGEVCARKIGDIAYAVLIANAAMGDGKALFHADHNNLLSGAAVGVDSYAEAIKAMKLQKDISGKRRLNIAPKFHLAPVSLEGQHTAFFASQYFVDGDTSGTRENPYYKSSNIVRVFEARLDDDSETAWYLLGAKGKTVKLFFLNGVQKPYLETRQGFNVDGAEYKVRIDCGAKAMEFRGMQKNPGV